MAQYVHADLQIPKQCLAGQNLQVNKGVTEIIKANNFITGTVMQFNPILPNLTLELALSCQFDEWYIDAGNMMTYTIYADNAEHFTGEILLNTIPIKIIR
jgi:hypothetical protein